MHLEHYLDRWERIASCLYLHFEHEYSCDEEREDIIEWIEQDERGNYEVRENRVIDLGWRVSDWEERYDDGIDVSMRVEEPWDMGVTAIVEICFKEYPSIDTTPFVTFRRLAEMQFWHETEPSRYTEDRRSLLREAYHRAADVAERIHMIESELMIDRIRDHYQLKEFYGTHSKWDFRTKAVAAVENTTRVSIDRSNRMITIAASGREGKQVIGPVEPHEAAYIQALIEARLDGTLFVSSTVLKLLPIAEGRNIERDFNGSPTQRVRGIKQKYKKLMRLIQSRRGKGRYLTT